MTEKVMGLFILDGKGNFGQGFIVSLKNYSGDLPSLDALEAGGSGELPPAPNLPELYKVWQDAYRNYLEIRAYNPNANNSPATFALKARPVGTNVGDYQQWENQKRQTYHACIQAEKELLKRFHDWLDYSDFQEVKNKFLSHSKEQENRILIESNDQDFQKMPWQKWDLLTPFSLSEVGLSSPNFKKISVPIKPKERARVLVILGQDANIQPEIEKLATANIEIKVVTKLAELNEPLWNEAWDIIVFNGHSGTFEKGTEGKFLLSQDQWLSISDIRNHFDRAIRQGLKLVIFNSCDGLGLAHQLGEGQKLYLPQIIVMRDFLPVPLAPVFLQYFFEEFIKGISLYSALRATRDRLKILEKEFPCASWLPLLCQNPAEISPSWSNFYDSETQTPIGRRVADRGLGDILTQPQPTLQTYPLPINIQSLADETDPSAILIQRQPTLQIYPLPINIQSLANETDPSAIYQELCTLIYSLALPETDIPTVSNFAQLKQQILTVKKQLQKRHLALIFHNCKPHPPLLTCCRKIADAKLGLHILWITDEPLEAPLRGFPPSQDNLLGAMQSWLEEF